MSPILANDTLLGEADSSGMMGGMMQDLAFAIPGVDEAMGFAEIMKCVKQLCIRQHIILMHHVLFRGRRMLYLGM